MPHPLSKTREKNCYKQNTNHIIKVCKIEYNKRSHLEFKHIKDRHKGFFVNYGRVVWQSGNESGFHVVTWAIHNLPIRFQCSSLMHYPGHEDKRCKSLNFTNIKYNRQNLQFSKQQQMSFLLVMVFKDVTVYLMAICLLIVTLPVCHFHLKNTTNACFWFPMVKN